MSLAKRSINWSFFSFNQRKQNDYSLSINSNFVLFFFLSPRPQGYIGPPSAPYMTTGMQQAPPAQPYSDQPGPLQSLPPNISAAQPMYMRSVTAHPPLTSRLIQSYQIRRSWLQTSLARTLRPFMSLKKTRYFNWQPKQLP